MQFIIKSECDQNAQNRTEVAMAKKRKEFDIDKLTSQELMRFEIARELGLDDKIITGGWGTLSAQESGRIGGIIASRNRKKRTAGTAGAD